MIDLTAEARGKYRNGNSINDYSDWCLDWFACRLLSGDAENIPGSVAAGAASAFGCMIQLMLMALPFLIGIWLIGAVFG